MTHQANDGEAERIRAEYEEKLKTMQKMYEEEQGNKQRLGERLEVVHMWQSETLQWFS